MGRQRTCTECGDTTEDQAQDAALFVHMRGGGQVKTIPSLIQGTLRNTEMRTCEGCGAVQREHLVQKQLVVLPDVLVVPINCVDEETGAKVCRLLKTKNKC